MQHVKAALIILAVLWSRSGLGQATLDWQKVVVEPGRTGLKRVTFLGKADPGAKVTVEADGIVWVTPDPSIENLELPKSFPTMLSDFLKKLPVENRKKSGVKEVAVSIRNCDARVKPDKRSPKKGRVRKGKKLNARTLNGRWIQFTSKGKPLFLPSSCVAMKSDQIVLSSTATADDSGEFLMTLELPPGTIQIPVELEAGGEPQSYLAAVEIKADEVLKSDDDKVVAQQAEANGLNGLVEKPNRQYSLSLIGGSQAYKLHQADSQGTFDLDTGQPSFGLEFEWRQRKWGLKFNYRFSDGVTSINAPISATEATLRWENLGLIYWHQWKNTVWNYQAGLVNVVAPFYDVYSLATAIENLSSLQLVLGGGYEFAPIWNIQHHLDLTVRSPVKQKSKVHDINGFAGYRLQVTYEMRYHLGSRYFVGGELTAVSAKETIYRTDRSITDLFFGLRGGLDF